MTDTLLVLGLCRRLEDHSDFATSHFALCMADLRLPPRGRKRRALSWRVNEAVDPRRAYREPTKKQGENSDVFLAESVSVAVMIAPGANVPLKLAVNCPWQSPVEATGIDPINR